MQVEERLLAAYIDSKSSQLHQVLNSFFQEDMAVWPQAAPPTQLRDVCLEVLFSLVSVCVSPSHKPSPICVPSSMNVKHVKR